MYITSSVSYSVIGNCLSFVEIPFHNQNRCVISWLYVRVFYRWVSAGILVHRYSIHNSLSRTVANRCISIPFANPICLYSNYFSWMSIPSFLEFSCFFSAEKIVRAKTSTRMFSDMTQIQLLCLLYSLIRRVVLLQRALRWSEFLTQAYRCLLVT